MMDELKQQFVDCLKSAYGVITVACEAARISRGAYYNWRNTDAEFRAAVDEVMEVQGDFVESKLLKLIDQGDTTATIFYCKTKLKNRGYSERVVVKAEPPTPEIPQQPIIEVAAKEVRKQLPAPETPQLSKAEIAKRKVKGKKAYIVKLLKEQGKYTPELSMQCNIVAQLLVKTEMLAEEIFDDSHKSVNVEISREGNERERISEKEKLYMDYLQQSQKALRALGMNTDSRERKTDNDGFSDFIKQFNDEEE